MANWTEESIQAPLRGVNRVISVWKAVLTFGVTKSTLQAHNNNDDIGSVGKLRILKWKEELLPVTLITFMSDIGFGLCKLQIRANISARFSPHSTPNHNRSLIKTLKNILIDNTPTSEVHLTSAVLSSLKKQYGSKLQKGEPNVMTKYNIDYLMTLERAIQH